MVLVTKGIDRFAILQGTFDYSGKNNRYDDEYG